MKELLEKAQALTDSLITKNREADERKANLDKREGSLDGRQAELDAFQAELLDRESKVQPVENLGEMFDKATQLKAEAESEWNKIRGEWQKLDSASAKASEEVRIGKKEIADKKALYDRGAEENKKKADQLNKKLKAIQEAQV